MVVIVKAGVNTEMFIFYWSWFGMDSGDGDWEGGWGCLGLRCWVVCGFDWDVWLSTKTLFSKIQK